MSTENTATSYARVFALIPEQSDQAIILRRGPSKHVGVYSWNLENNHIELAQWLKGRIHEYFCDVSPDGKYFIFCFFKKSCGYTAISRAPWIKAILLLKNLGGWGGGFFWDNKHFKLSDVSSAYKVEYLSDELDYVQPDKPSNAYGERLKRRAWGVVPNIPDASVYAKTLDKNTYIEKILPHFTVKKSKGKGIYWEYHRFTQNGHVIEKKDWEWCEYRNGQLYWSEKGRLYSTTWNGYHSIEQGKLLYDFNAETFVEKCAPY